MTQLSVSHRKKSETSHDVRGLRLGVADSHYQAETAEGGWVAP
jgi:hypothetical protein